VATAVFQTIRPSVVYITARRPGAGPEDSMSGAGVVVSADAQILTARHVVNGAQSIQIVYADGSQGTAQIASQEADQDIAVLMPDAPPSLIVPAVLGGGVQVGDDVFAVGHPLGLAGSLTAGVVSGLNRTIPVEGGTALNGLIQFDAAVNPGNSGGPLLNRAGQVVGIVTALANPSQQPFFVGIGFAVPIATAGGAAGAPQQ
jgi:S1-C subfamily serine protease